MVSTKKEQEEKRMKRMDDSLCMLVCKKCTEKLGKETKTPHTRMVKEGYATCNNCGKNQAL